MRRRCQFLALVASVVLALTACQAVSIQQQATYADQPTQTISGAVILRQNDPLVGVTVNGVAATIDGKNYTASIPLDGAAVFNRVLVVAEFASGDTSTQRATVAYADGSHATAVPNDGAVGGGLVTRLNASGLGKLGPAVAANLAISGSEFAAPQQTFGGGLITYSIRPGATATLGTKAAGLGSISGALVGTATLSYVHHVLPISGSVLGIAFSCSLLVDVNALSGAANYALAPNVSDPTGFDLTLASSIQVTSSVSASGCGSVGVDFSDAVEYTESYSQSVLAQLLSALGGPAELRAAIHEVLGGLNVTGAIGGPSSGLGLSAPFAGFAPSASGLAASEDATVVAASLAAGAPAQTRSLAFGALAAGAPGSTTPQGFSYDLAFGASVASLNQLLAAETERGFLSRAVTNVSGQALTYNGLDALVDLGAPLATDRALEAIVAPELAPAIDASAGSAVSIGTLHLGGYRVTIRYADDHRTLLEVVTDFDASAHLAIHGGAVELAVAPPAVVTVDVITDPQHLDADTAGAVFDALAADLLGPLVSGLPAFPAPQLPGLDITMVEAARLGSSIYLFATLG